MMIKILQRTPFKSEWECESKDQITIGKGPMNDIMIEGNKDISREHFILNKIGEKFHLESISIHNFFVDGNSNKSHREISFSSQIKLHFLDTDLEIFCSNK